MNGRDADLSLPWEMMYPKQSDARETSMNELHREVISQLEEALADARKGHYHSMALVLMDDKGAATVSLCNNHTAPSLMGHVQKLLFRLTASSCEE